MAGSALFTSKMIVLILEESHAINSKRIEVMVIMRMLFLIQNYVEELRA